MAKILVADDTRFMRRLLLFTLEKAGHETLVVEDGEEALRAAAAAPPDLFILDVIMPKLDGLSTLKRLRSNAATSATPAIMLTSRGQKLTAQEAEACGANAFLTKPFSPSDLLERVQELTKP